MRMMPLSKTWPGGRAKSTEAELGPGGPTPVSLLIPLNTARQPQSPTTMGPMDLDIHIGA
ncbi:hypothetical protein AALO_G00220860 [Alosa alosa]|uniref:Uncharacterized protein n=1 Tax=Alosa alosa TaxID=278164 RepID=A0AAV6G086_9TELE|nr:hypothetical protein AALO_G00220860 [Alosa alosa]